MNSVKKWIVLVALTASTSSFATGRQGLEISGHYGTVGYSGTVMRVVEGSDYVFTVHGLTLTFQPQAKVNSVPSIVNPTLSLVTTVLQPGKVKSSRTSRTPVLLHLTLDNEHPSTKVHDVRFKVARATVDASTNTILDLSNGQFLWPFASQLKPGGKSLQSPGDDH